MCVVLTLPVMQPVDCVRGINLASDLPVDCVVLILPVIYLKIVYVVFTNAMM